MVLLERTVRVAGKAKVVSVAAMGFLGRSANKGQPETVAYS